MRISRFDESKKGSDKKKEKDNAAAPFDVESTIIDKEVVGFKTQEEELTKAAEKKLKKQIQNDGNTPGLKKAIKKFEEFVVMIDLGDDAPAGSEEVSGCECCSSCTGDADCACGCEDCQCSPVVDVETDDLAEVTPFSQYTISEKLSYHLSKGISVVENVFRPGSDSFVELIREARTAHDSGKVRFSGQDRYLFENTDLGRFAKFNGQEVPLDLPMEMVEELNEAEYKGKKVELNHPMRGGSKKYYVYVMNPATHKVKKIAFGDVHGGLTAKVSNAKARKNFASRHDCKNKKDKTKAGYWACRINRYGHLWGGKTYPGYW